MSPLPGDPRRAPSSEDATLPPSAAGSKPAGAAPGALTVPVVPDLPPELVNHPRYRVLKLLGQGGMGAVYLAEHLVMGRRVALKTISTHFLANREAVARFHREVRAAAKLVHPNIVTAFDAEQAGNLHFLVMEYVDGASVADYARRKKPLPVDQACAIVSQAALGLQHAHEQGLIHRDVKPANLMLTRKGQVKVLDFGLAQFTRHEDSFTDAARTATGAVMGTADYIAPEQTSSSRKVDIRADIYSLGCTLYYLLAGRVPFPDGTVIDKCIHHATDTPTPLASLRTELPAGVVEVVEKMMAKRPEDRYQAPIDVVRGLRPFTGRDTAPSTVPAAAAPPGAAEDWTQRLGGEPAPKEAAKPGKGEKRRNRVLIAAGAGALAVAGLIAVLLLVLGRGSSGAVTQKAAAPSPPPRDQGGKAPAWSVTWSGKGPTHPLVAPEHNIKSILDFKEIEGATLTEFRQWQTGLPQGYRLSFLSNRVGIGPPLFNGVAVHDRVAVPTRVFISLNDDEAAKVGERLKAEGVDLDYRVHCAYSENGQYRHSMLWAPDSGDGYFWFGSFDFVKGKVSEEKAGHHRPYALDAVVKGDDRIYSAFGTGEGGVDWKAFFNLTGDDLLARVEEHRTKGWRPDVLAPHWDGERFRFMLVVRANPEPVDWRLQFDMSLQDYQKASAEERGRGRFPLKVTSYGDEAAVKYAALWVRYRIQE
jgi:tRNA A-37 threonylcarbamoyl transferase component Bud32